MLDDLERRIDVERRQLRRLMETHAAILEKCGAEDPTPDELAAIAAVLHSFYNGVENIFKRVSAAIDGSTPRGLLWHTELIDSMSTPTPNRPAMLSPALSEILQEYMDFRHLFRHAYSFELRWSKMRHLAAGLKDVLRRFENEMDIFISRLKS